MIRYHQFSSLCEKVFPEDPEDLFQRVLSDLLEHAELSSVVRRYFEGRSPEAEMRLRANVVHRIRNLGSELRRESRRRLRLLREAVEEGRLSTGLVRGSAQPGFESEELESWYQCRDHQEFVFERLRASRSMRSTLRGAGLEERDRVIPSDLPRLIDAHLPSGPEEFLWDQRGSG